MRRLRSEARRRNVAIAEVVRDAIDTVLVLDSDVARPGLTVIPSPLSRRPTRAVDMNFGQGRK